jgi:sugar/nucleoside kinase (ribokinase family)
VEIKDTSGAGDTFLSGLVCNYEKTGDIREAIEFANACATTVVQKRGVSVI